MYVPDVELHESHSLEEASALLTRHAPDVRLLAGGTDLLVDLKAGRVSVRHLVSLSRIDALRGVSLTADGLRIGALTTITQLDRSDPVRERFAPIRDATSRMAARQIRNVATVGGNIVSAVPCADLPPILTVMNASVMLWSPDGERSVALRDFFVDARRTVRRDEELLIAITVPTPSARFGAAYARFGLREGNAIAVAAVAAGVRLGENDMIQDAQIALGAVAPTPKRVEAARTALLGARPDDDDAFGKAADAAMEAAEPICDVRGSAEYRRELVGVLTRRALATACERARENPA